MDGSGHDCGDDGLWLFKLNHITPDVFNALLPSILSVDVIFGSGMKNEEMEEGVT